MGFQKRVLKTLFALTVICSIFISETAFCHAEEPAKRYHSGDTVDISNINCNDLFEPGAKITSSSNFRIAIDGNEPLVYNAGEVYTVDELRHVGSKDSDYASLSKVYPITGISAYELVLSSIEFEGEMSVGEQYPIGGPSKVIEESDVKITFPDDEHLTIHIYGKADITKYFTITGSGLELWEDNYMYTEYIVMPLGEYYVIEIPDWDYACAYLSMQPAGGSGDPDGPGPGNGEQPDDFGYYLTALENSIEVSGKSNTQEATTLAWNEGDSLPLSIMEMLADNPKVSLLFTFTYEGKEHTVLIPAGQALCDSNIPWYGPAWLLQKYGEYIPGAESGEYIVVSGDTLNDIAKRFGTTVDDLMAKNPEIKDRNKIYPGDVIKY